VAVGVILPAAALALGVPLLVALVLPAWLTWRRSGDDEIAALSGALSAQVVDAVQGAPELLAFGADLAALHSVDELASRADAVERRHARLATLNGVITQLCLAAAVTAVLAVGVDAVHTHTIGQVMVAVLPLAALATFETVPGVPLAVARARVVRASADRLFALDAVAVPVHDPADPDALGDGVPDVAFDDASLRYGPGLPRALDGVSLALAAGSTLAVTGSSGAGKTSLVHALLRFWPLEGGSLAVGGSDTTRLAAADVRAACALADQRAHLFAGSVRTNLVLGRPDASDAELATALAAAQLDEWVATLPEGLDTPVGDDGVAISGGERRRLAVARALLAPGSVLVLDEPTSALDPGLADRVVGGVLASAAATGRSVLVVTHRQAEADRCAAAVAFEGGRLVPARP
jgi:ABC-type transport system involved in cytochrome bd biosynthesis fused ATPase/permease subunit